jgi:hypothetical protein
MLPSIKRKNWSKEAMCHAITVVRSGEMGYLRASMLTGTLERYVKNTAILQRS